MSKEKHLLFVSGSLRNCSSHHALLEHLKETNPQYNILIYEGLEDLPNFNPDKDVKPFPNAVVNFRNSVSAACAVLICTPEYAYGVPGSLKNALDWTVSSGSFIDKPVGVITASGLGEYTHASVLLIFEALNAKLIDGAALHISWFKTKMDNNNRITDLQTKEALQNVFKSLITSL